MSYEKTTWKDGDIISEVGLNKMEDGIAAADQAAATAQSTADAAQVAATANAEKITAGEAKDAEQDTAIATAQAAADQVKTTAEANAAKNVEQDSNIEAAKTAADAAQAGVDSNTSKIGEIEAKNTEQDSTMTDLTTRVETLENKIPTVEQDVQDLKTDDEMLQDMMSFQDGRATVLEQKLALLEVQMADLQTRGLTTEDLTSGNVTSSEDIVVAPAAPITTPTTITAKSMVVKNMDVQSSKAILTTTGGDALISNVTMSGDLQKKVSNAALSVNAENSIVKITDSDMNQTGYNSIEVGLSKVSKMVLIDNIDFRATLANNAISVFGMKEGGTLTVSNCHFADCSNPVRISNKENTPFTINLVNCVFDKWDARLKWAGIMLFQDFTSPAEAGAIAEANQFGRDKITVNLINCIGPNGEKITAPEDLATICGTQDEHQLFYVYNETEDIVPYTGNEHRYPTFNFM